MGKGGGGGGGEMGNTGRVRVGNLEYIHLISQSLHGLDCEILGSYEIPVSLLDGKEEERKRSGVG